MQKDKLETFIETNQQEFNQRKAPPLVWTAIEKELDKKPRKPFRLRYFLSIAAAAAVLLCVGVAMGIQYAQPSIESKLLASHPEYLEAEKHYKQMVNYKINEVQALGKQEYVQQDLKQLDAVYQELKNELLSAGVGDEELIVEAMIDHYKSKLELLSIVLDKLKNQNTTNLNLNEEVNM